MPRRIFEIRTEIHSPHLLLLHALDNTSINSSLSLLEMSAPTPIPYLLTADVGGTNSRMGLYSLDNTVPLVVKYYRNEECLTKKEDGIFENNVIAPFLQHCWGSNSNLLPLEQVEIIACLAIAGPVRNNAAWMSNLHNIVIDGTAIANQIHIKNEPYLARIKVCKIINDFVAQGYGCLTLKPSEMIELTPGSFQKMDSQGPKVCVGAGTGLGECFLTPDSQGRYTCFASEGGHVEWAPRNKLEIEMWNFLRDKFSYRNRLSVERVVSGPGLANIYEFLAHKYPNRIDTKVHAEFEEETDMKGKVVAVNATKGSLCRQAMEMMMG
jgi:glucokinase